MRTFGGETAAVGLPVQQQEQLNNRAGAAGEQQQDGRLAAQQQEHATPTAVRLAACADWLPQLGGLLRISCSGTPPSAPRPLTSDRERSGACSE